MDCGSLWMLSLALFRRLRVVPVQLRAPLGIWGRGDVGLLRSLLTPGSAESSSHGAMRNSVTLRCSGYNDGPDCAQAVQTIAVALCDGLSSP